MATRPSIIPIALGLISDPPTIVLTYDSINLTETESIRSKSKRRKRKMPLRDFTDRSNVKRYAFNLRQRHPSFLSAVMDVTLEKMLRMIQEIQKGKDVEASLALVDKEYEIDPEEDLNVISPALLALRKAVMDETFQKNLIRPGDAGYEYDKPIDFNTENVESGNDWDEDNIPGVEAVPKESELSSHDNVDVSSVVNLTVPEIDENVCDKPVHPTVDEAKTFENCQYEHPLGLPTQDKNISSNALEQPETDKLQEKESLKVETQVEYPTESLNISDTDQPVEKIETVDIDDDDDDFW